MSEAIKDPGLQAQLADIQRSYEETRKFVAEQHKLMAEAQKLQRDTRYAPILVAVAAIGSIAGFIAASIAALKATGRL